jgi:hypothetical protein
MYTKPLSPLSDWDSKRAGVVKISIDFRKGTEDWQTAYRNNVAHGWERLRLRWENLVLVMLGPSWPDNNPEFVAARIADGMRWIWTPLFLLLMTAAVVRYRTTLERPLLPVLIMTWFVFQVPSLLAINEGRYRKPLEGLLIAEGIVVLDSMRRRSRLPARG